MFAYCKLFTVLIITMQKLKERIKNMSLHKISLNNIEIQLFLSFHYVTEMSDVSTVHKF